MMRVCIFLLTLLKFSSSSVYKSVKRDTDEKIIQEEIDEDLSDFFDEVEKAQEVLEVPIEYEDDNKPSKTQSGFPHINGFVLPIPFIHSVFSNYFSSNPRRVGGEGRKGGAAL